MGLGFFSFFSGLTMIIIHIHISYHSTWNERKKILLCNYNASPVFFLLFCYYFLILVSAVQFFFFFSIDRSLWFSCVCWPRNVQFSLEECLRCYFKEIKQQKIAVVVAASGTLITIESSYVENFLHNISKYEI